MKKKIYELLKLLLCLLFFFFFPNFFVIILNFLGIDVVKFNGIGTATYQFIITIIMAFVFACSYFKEIKKDFKKFFNKNIIKNILYIIKMFIIFMLIKYVVSFISAFIMMALGFDISNMTSINQSMIEEYVKAAPILMFITTAILAPIYEEILFRIGFKRNIKNRFLFIIISGSLFGLLHIFPLDDGVSLLLGITQSISYVTMGIVLSYIYIKNDNIFMSIGVHFLNNLISVIALISML